MIQAAEEAGIIKPGALIIEPTSGNQGIALAMVGAVRGYRVVLVMPENMSVERRKLMEAFGAEVVLTPAEEDLAGAVLKAQELAGTTPGAWMPDQFNNPTNPDYHERTTGQEVLAPGRRTHRRVPGGGRHRRNFNRRGPQASVTAS